MDLINYFVFLDSNTTDALKLAKDCPPSRLSLKKDNEWNIMEILEHICIVDKVCIALISKPTSETSSEKTEIFGNDKLRHILVAKRDIKVQTPEMLKPKGMMHDVTEFEKVFTEQRDLLKQNLTSGKIIIDNKPTSIRFWAR